MIYTLKKVLVLLLSASTCFGSANCRALTTVPENLESQNIGYNINDISDFSTSITAIPFDNFDDNFPCPAPVNSTFTSSFLEENSGDLAFDFSATSEQTIEKDTDAQALDETTSEALSENIKVGSRFWELLFGQEEETRTLIACGDVFGVKIEQEYPSVVESSGVPALKAGDYITEVNGQEVHSANEVKKAVSESEGEAISIKAKRGDTEIKIIATPKNENGNYTLGITLRDITAGLGTITFIDPKTGEFGGLGHGICDSESGEVIPIEGGEAVDIVLGGIHKGEAGTPGELYGIMTERVIGTIEKNTETGVFGTLNASDFSDFGELYEVAEKSDVTAGEATIISTLRNGRKAEYKIEIYDVDQNSSGSKSFKIKVTDPMLLTLSGGIIRGMSGSPIIQNGKLIGAVTHVCVNL